MNHIYHSIWNEALSAWVAVSEIVIGQGKRSSNRRKTPPTASYSRDWQLSSSFSLPLATGLLLCASASWALPTGNELVAGEATVAAPTATQMQINQTSDRAVINWQGFSIGQNEAVNIQQPNAQAALLNRVVGQDASQIQGKLNANGQVYLVNPNGVVFSKTAQVDVGGLVATTHNIKDADFIADKNHFTQDGAKGTVENHGTINTANGGIVALIGESVTNTGTINTPKGTTVLTAGKTVDLDFQGNGLVEVTVTEAALNAQINNQGAIQADAGRVVLSAKAANALVDTVINQDGIIKAQGLIERNGTIILDGGDNGAVKVSGTLDTSNTNQGLNASTTGGNITVKGAAIQLVNGANVNASSNTGGGTITIGDKQTTQQTTIAQGATISANTLDSGKAGTINVLASMDNGLVKVDGQLEASAPKNGDGGFIDTSAAHVNVSDTAKITTEAVNGETGTWLIDPKDYTIAATGGDMTGTALSTSLATTNVNIASTAGANGVNGDVNVNQAVSWTSNRTLTLNAQNSININANISSTGATGKLALQYGQSSAAGGTSDYVIANGTTVNLSAGQNFSTQKGTAGVIQNYTVITSLGTLADATTLPAIMTLQGMNMGLAGKYVLGANIDANPTASAWGAVGFMPVGTNINAIPFPATPFTGKFDGLGHTISGLTINRPTTDSVGLFGKVSGGSVSNVGLLGGSVIGRNYVGGLVGSSDTNSTINNAYATGSVNGAGSTVGGLVGLNSATINNAYATGSVSGVSGIVGGLVGGNNSGSINNAYATGRVMGGSSVGGLVGVNLGGNINNVYATGVVNSTSAGSATGGLVGYNSGIGSINNAYATGSVNATGSGSTGGVGGLVGINANSTINNAYATGSVSSTNPIDLVGGLVGNTKGTGITTNSFWNTQTTGQVTSAGGTGLTTAQMKQLSTFTNWSISNAGGSSAVWRIYEGQSAPLLHSFLIPVNVSADNLSKTYNGQAYTGALSNPVYSVAGAGSSGHLFNLNAPYINAVNVATYAPPSLYSDQQGYDISQTNGVLTITPAILNLSGTRIYDGTLKVSANILTLNGLVNGETLNLSGNGTFLVNNVASSKTIYLGTLALGNGTGLASNYTLTGGTHKAAVTPAILNLSGTRAYDGTTTVDASIFTLSGLVGSETLNLSGIGTIADKNIGSNKPVSLGTLALSNGTGSASNYSFTGGKQTATITSVTPVTPVVPVVPVVPTPPSVNQSTNPSVLTPDPSIDNNTPVAGAGSLVITDPTYQNNIGGLIGTIINPPTTPPNVNPPKVEIIITSPIQETTKIINTVLDFSTPTGQILYLSKEFSTFLSGVANVMIKDPTELADLYVNEWGGSRFDMELQLYNSRMSMIRVVDGAQNEMVNQEYGYALQSISDTINLALDANDTFNAITGLKDAPKKIKTAFTAITKVVKDKPLQLAIAIEAIATFLNNVDNLSDIDAIYKTFDRILGKSLDADVIKALKSVKTMSELIPKNAKNVETIKKFLKDSLAFVALGTSTTSIEQIMKNDADRKIFLQDKLIEKLSTRADWKDFANMPVYQKVSVFNDGLLWDSYTYKLVETTAKEAYPDLFK